MEHLFSCLGSLNWKEVISVRTPFFPNFLFSCTWLRCVYKIFSKVWLHPFAYAFTSISFHSVSSRTSVMMVLLILLIILVFYLLQLLENKQYLLVIFWIFFSFLFFKILSYPEYKIIFTFFFKK